MADLPDLRQKLDADFVIVNGENAAGGFGITEAIAEGLFDAGVDVITLGNHAFDQRETLGHIEREPRLLRPLNYPKRHTGQGCRLVSNTGWPSNFNCHRHGAVVYGNAGRPFYTY